mmetsp:Transcript_4122/g.11979  ORF Transcript_4122/g.11979 Transcript_4122/m.11979 type:complete len:281 (+) Transcript_4122:69-911(+)
MMFKRASESSLDSSFSLSLSLPPSPPPPPLEDVPVLGLLVQPLGVGVSEVADAGGLRQVHELLEGLPDGDLPGLVGGGLGPQGDSVSPVPHRDHGAADLVALRELLPNHGEKQVQPGRVRVALARRLGVRHGPLATVRAHGVLPLWLDALLKDVEVSTRDESRGWDDVVVQAPEVFDGLEGVHAPQGLAPGRLLLLPVRVVEPERPRVLERVLENQRESESGVSGKRVHERRPGRGLVLTFFVRSRVTSFFWEGALIERSLGFFKVSAIVCGVCGGGTRV